MNKNTRITVSLMIMLLMLLGSMLMTGCGQLQPADTEATQEAEAFAMTLEAENAGVSAEAEIVPVQYAVLSFPVSGILAAVNVSEGDSVAAGEVIAVLDGKERLEADVAAAELAVLQARQALNDLYANAALARAEAALAYAQAKLTYDDALEDQEDLAFRHGDQDLIDIAYADYIVAQRAAREAEEAYQRYADRPEEDKDRAEALAILTDAREARDIALARWNYYKSKPDQFDIAETEGQLEIASSSLAKAEREWLRLKDGPDPDDTALLKAELNASQARLVAARKALDDLILEAPFSGEIVSSTLTVGELVQPETIAVRMADFSAWHIETTDLTELDIVDVNVGDVVEVSFDALPDFVITGHVKRIKQLGENKQGDVTYTVVIVPDEDDERFRWNMTAYVAFQPW